MNSEAEPSTSMSLLDQAKGGDHAAWDLLVRIYTPLIFRRCRAMNLTQEDASDIVQEVFLKLWKRLNQFETRPDGGFRNWLRTVTRNEVNDWFRSRPLELDAIGGTDALLCHLEFPEIVTDVSLLSSATPNETQSALKEALARIRPEFSDRDWTLFVRTQVDGVADKQVAEELGMSHGSARMALSRVRMRLKELIGDTEGSDSKPDSPVA